MPARNEKALWDIQGNACADETAKQSCATDDAEFSELCHAVRTHYDLQRLKEFCVSVRHCPCSHGSPQAHMISKTHKIPLPQFRVEPLRNSAEILKHSHHGPLLVMPMKCLRNPPHRFLALYVGCQLCPARLDILYKIAPAGNSDTQHVQRSWKFVGGTRNFIHVMVRVDFAG